MKKLKINNFIRIGLMAILLLIVLFSVKTKAQTSSDEADLENPPKPTVKGVVVNDGEGLSALIIWSNEPAIVGYIFTENGVEGLDIENYPVGFDNKSAGNWSLRALDEEDKGKIITYGVKSYDRGGEESAPASVDVKIEEGLNPTYILFPNQRTEGGDIVLSWTKPCKCDGEFEFEILRDGDSIAKTRATYYVDRGAAATSPHDYMILAYRI